MFAQIEIEAGSSERFVTLPQTAIVYEPYGNSVYIIEKDSADKKTSQSTGFTARQSFVQLGNVRGDQVAVQKGVSPGVLVVVAGQLKLRNGTAVKIENKIQLPNDPTPTLHDK
jgi:membrane fusion protein (multidrug efflux system)